MDSSDLKRLSETEAEVMRTIWSLAGSVTVTQILQIFAETKNWKTSTLSTILARLQHKGFLSKTLVGNINYYTPTLLEEEYKKRETKSFLTAIHNGSVKSFFAALAEDEEMAAAEISEIRQWFGEKAGDKI